MEAAAVPEELHCMPSDGKQWRCFSISCKLVFAVKGAASVVAASSSGRQRVPGEIIQRRVKSVGEAALAGRRGGVAVAAAGGRWADKNGRRLEVYNEVLALLRGLGAAPPSAYEDAIWAHFHGLPACVDSGLIDALGFNAVARIDYRLWNLMASLGFNAVVSVRVSNETIDSSPSRYLWWWRWFLASWDVLYRWYFLFLLDEDECVIVSHV
uniref:Uncharacterized protein n=1 Tax=Oryza punctata TaxID=4537 RepID=A0A0E0LYA5_ORYPU